VIWVVINVFSAERCKKTQNINLINDCTCVSYLVEQSVADFENLVHKKPISFVVLSRGLKGSIGITVC